MLYAELLFWKGTPLTRFRYADDVIILRTGKIITEITYLFTKNITDILV